jgi:hypothetical protein
MNSGSDGGGGPPGGGTSQFPPGGVTFPWQVFDGMVPDVPESATGKTWYCDPVKGDDFNDGSSFAKAKRTVNAALGVVAAGDTILLGGGIYREYPEWSNAASGKAGAPVTIGSYGRGTGAPILDGGLKPNTWTRYTGAGQTTVWQSSTAGTLISATMPVLGIYVGSDKGEFALREVLHGQVTQYPGDPLPPNQTQDNITDGSSNFYYTNNTVYADFGGVLGQGDPNGADVSLIYDSQNSGGGHQNLVYLGQGHDYFTFVGITFRASSWSGVFTESHGHVFDRCDFKFNGGAAALFSYSGDQLGSHITVTKTRIWMNILENWPRFNNGNTGGGWPAAIDWSSQSDGLAEGNVVYMNGGEGLTVGNSDVAGAVSMNNVVRHNIIFDNFSVNLYVNNTQNVRLEENYVFQHPRDDNQTFTGLFQVSPGYDQDYGKRISPMNVTLGDEPGSAYDGQAHLAGITLINNIFAGGNFGFVDYDDGTVGPAKHGLKNCTILNNTWILGDRPINQVASFLWMHDGTDGSTGSVLQNNLFVTQSAADRFVQAGSMDTTGVNDDYNLYGGPGVWHDPDGDMDFAAWKKAYPAWDQHSLNTDAQITDVAEFFQPVEKALVYDWSKAAPKAGSPAFGGGNTQQAISLDFTGNQRAAGMKDIGALAPR